MLPRPSFLTTVAERACMVNVRFDPYLRYVNIAKGIYEWSGMPKDMPIGYIEEALFWYGCVGAKYSESLQEVVVLPAVPGLRTVYNEPLDWTPTGLQGYQVDPQLLERSDLPALYLGASVYEQIQMYVEVLQRAYYALRQNVVALSQPIALGGRPGNNAEGLMLKADMDGGEMFIPVLDVGQLKIEVIDLKAKDWTQQLIATANAMDNEILTVMGVNNTGTEKASGVTIEEATSLHQELVITSDIGLRKRKDWCTRINAALGTSFSVEISDAYKVEGKVFPMPNGPENGLVRDSDVEE